MSRQNNNNSNYKDLIYGSILFIFVIALWYFSWQYIDNSVVSIDFELTDIEARGLFGDKFGAINALFSSLAFAGIIFTIFLQKRELKLQREEMEETRGEFIKQNDTLIRQKFENTFFQLVNLFNSIVNSIDLRNSKSIVTTSGRDCFVTFHKRLERYLEKLILEDGTPFSSIDQSTIEQAIKAYDTLYVSNRSDLSHYFRTFYHIIKFVENSEIDNKKQYIAIARAQLSSHEQIILFYNCLHENGIEKFKPLIETHSLFKNIDDSLILNIGHLDEYSDGAYGDKTTASNR